MKCSFCGNEIRRGTGILFIKNDGTQHPFCSSKCQRNLRIRKPSNVKWTEEFRKRKAAKVTKK